nr:MAG TPA: hypothetical protein [Caudoviricetes sp.]
MKSARSTKNKEPRFAILDFMLVRIHWMYLDIIHRLIPDIAKSSWMQTIRNLTTAKE